MIIECEECHKRYLVSDSAIGDEGRIVRCTHCSHMWHQNPEDVEAFDPDVDSDAEDASFGDEVGDDDDEAEDAATSEDFVVPVDDGVDDLDEGDGEKSQDDAVAGVTEVEAEDVADSTEVEKALPPVDGEEASTEEDEAKGSVFSDDGMLHNIMEGIRHDDMSPQAKRNGYIGAAVVFALQMFMLLALHGPIVKKMPFMNKAYSLVGITPKLPGEKLILDGVKAELVSDAGGIETLHISGVIMNRQPGTDKVPDVSVSVKNPDGSYGFEQGVKLRQYLSEGGVVEFETSDVQDYPDDMSEVEVSLKWHPYMVYKRQGAKSGGVKHDAAHSDGHEDAHEKAHKDDHADEDDHAAAADDKHKKSDGHDDHH